MMERAIHRFDAWAATLKLIWCAAPGWTSAWAVLLVFQGMLPVALIYLTKLLVDVLTPGTGTGSVSLDGLPRSLTLVAIIGALLLLSEFLQSASEWARTAQSELIQDHIKGLVHQQAAAVDLAFYESADQQDRLYQACTEAATRPLSVLENLGGVLQNGITLLAMAAMLAPYGLWLPVVLLASTLPSFLTVVGFDRRYHDWWAGTTADRRRAQYYDALLTHKEAAAEVRLFALSRHFSDAYQALRRRLRSERLRQMRELSVAKLGAAASSLVIFGAAAAWMVWRTVQGLATLGDLVLLYQTFSRGQGIMRSLLGNFGQIITSELYIGNLFDFLNLPQRIVDPIDPTPAPASLRHGISFRNVTFRYPHSDAAVLQDFNLYIPAGRIVAIVGPNGAGKTTLFKLLCRFYDVDAGAIQLDGVDLRNIAVDDLRRQITTLFQFPVPYQATARENIALGDVQRTAHPEEIETAARNAGAHEVIERLPQGYDTLLGKWFANGVELSGGEQQRIALARAYLRQAPIILLDEPTSFIDSWAEAEWFERFRALAAGRTGIIITHRFTIAMRADSICVMEGGRIVEAGSHAELVKREGLYAQSWDVQMTASFTAGERTDASALAASGGFRDV